MRYKNFIYLLGIFFLNSNAYANLDGLRDVSLSNLQSICLDYIKVDAKSKCTQLGKSELRNFLINSLNTDSEENKLKDSYRFVLNELNQSTLYSDYMSICDAFKTYFPSDPNCTSIPDCEDSSIGEISRMAKKCVGISTIVSSNCSDWFYTSFNENELSVFSDFRYVKDLYKKLNIPQTEDGYQGKMFSKDSVLVGVVDLSYNKNNDLANILKDINFDYNKKFSYIVNKLSQYDETVKDRLTENWIKNCISEIYDNNNYINAKLVK